MPKRQAAVKHVPRPEKKPEVSGLREATEEEINEFVQKHNTTDRSLLGLQLTLAGLDADTFLVQQKIIEKLKAEEQAEQAALDNLFDEAVQAILSECNSCDSSDIRPKIIGTAHTSWGNNAYSRDEIIFLYCNSCGNIYYKEDLETLNQRLINGDFRAKPRYEREVLC